MTAKKSLYIFFALFLLENNVCAQQVIYTKGIQTLDATVTGNKVYYSDKQVSLKSKNTSGFTYTPNILEDFKGAIHPSAVFGSNSTDPLGQGDNRFLDYSLAVGSVAGGGGATGGSYRYGVNIEVPPGTGGIQPSISVGYSSGGGKSVVGKGWGLSATSMISRIGKNYYNHKEVKEVQLNNQDALILDGSLLIDLGNGVYRTEQEQFTEVSREANGSFVAQTRDGKLFYYGATTDSKLTLGGEVLSWYLSRVEDRFGNYMTYQYIRHGNEVLLDKIEYTGTSNFTPYNYVAFSYELRSDKSIYYEAGYGIQQNYLLKTISTYAEGQLVRSYAFTYSNELESRLMSVAESNALGEKFNPTVFRYGDKDIYDSGVIKSNNNFDRTDNYNNYINLITSQPNGNFLIDYDGDGLKEMIDFGFYASNAPHNRLQLLGYEYDLTHQQYIDKNRDEEGTLISGSLNNTINTVPQLEETDRAAYFDLELESFKYFINSNQISSQSGLSLPSDYNGDGFEDMFIVEEKNGTYYLTFLLGCPEGLKLINQEYEDALIPSQELGQPASKVRHLYTNTKFPLTSGKFPYLIPGDYNGDGRMELLWLKDYAEGSTLGIGSIPNIGPAQAAIISLNLTSDNIVVSNTLSNFYPTYENNLGEGELFLQQGDFNGDGISDFFTLERVGSGFLGEQVQGVVNLVRYNATTGTYSLERGGTTGYFKLEDNINKESINFGDFNGDGKVDILYNNSKIAYNTGNSFEIKPLGSVPITVGQSSQQTESIGFYQGQECLQYFANMDDIVVGDFNGDRRDDVMLLQVRNFATTSYQLYYSTGSGFVEGSKSGSFSGVLAGRWSKVLDIDGNGTDDIIGDIPHEETCAKVFDQLLIHLPATYTDALQTVSDGYGRTTRIEYEHLAQSSHYTRGEEVNYPLIELSAGLVLPVKITEPNGIGGNMVSEYSYSGLKYHAKGRGLLGFEKLTTTNLTTNFKEEQISAYRTDIAALLPEKQRTYQGTTLLSETLFTPGVHRFDSQRYLVYQDNVMSKDFTTNSVVVNTSQYTDFYLPPTQSSTVMGNITSSGSTSLETTTTALSYQTSPSRKGSAPILPVPLTQRITKERVGEAAYAREVENTYNGSAQLLTQTTDPGKDKAVTTSYAYDGFGNVLQAQSNAGGMATRSVATEYDAKGRFAVKAKNSLQYEATQSYDAKYGQVLNAKDINGLQSYFRYDSFGRIKEAEGPTGKKANVTYGWNQDSQIPALYFVESKAEGAPTSTTWYDLLGRPVMSKTDGLNKHVYQRTEYNNKGQVSKATSPYHEGDAPVVTTYTYDLLGRNTHVSNDIGTTTTIYELAGNNYKITTVSPNGQVYSVETDASGKQVKATDAGGTLTYSYYSLGQAKDVRLDGVVMSSMEYDDYGRQTVLNDADAGTTEYLYNAYGELERQKDANGNIYTFVYDELGRITQKNGPEGPTTYTYNESGNALGGLKSVTAANGFSTNYTYDQLARPSITTEQIGTETFVHRIEYDAFSRPSKATYPSGVQVSYNYNSKGYLTALTNPTYGTLWSTGPANAYGQLTQQTLGNGISIDKAYDTHGVLKSIYAKNVYDLHYAINLRTGNVSSREDKLTGKKEVFTYDVLDRLTKVEVNGTPTIELSYMPNGNIDTKSDVGTYTYDANKPHAVQHVHDLVTGAISTNTQQITYTPFLKVATIEEGDWKLEFNYDAGYSRKKVDYYNTTSGQLQKTHYYSGAYQKIVTPQNSSKEITYITGGDGLAAIVVKTDGNEQLYYAHQDMQGSIVALTNPQKQVAVSQTFDPWGKRTITPLTGEPEGAFNWLRGYTGHEHLDEFALINMNGRLYDPALGRMLSPDNFVQSPFYSQNYNRYSYVYNNPLKYTDPTGYVSKAYFDRENRRLQELKEFRETEDRKFLDFWAYGKAVAAANSWTYLYDVGGGGGWGGSGGGAESVVGDGRGSRNIEAIGWVGTGTSADLNMYASGVRVESRGNQASGWRQTELVMEKDGEIISRMGITGEEFEYFISEEGKSGVSLLASLYWHFQFGGGEDYHIKGSSLDFSGTSQKALGLDNLKIGDTKDPVNLFEMGRTNTIALAFGRVIMTKVSENQFKIRSNDFNFDPIYDSDATTGRNIANLLGIAVNYNLWLGPGSALVPAIFGGPFKIIFDGPVTIPK